MPQYKKYKNKNALFFNCFIAINVMHFLKYFIKLIL